MKKLLSILILTAVLIGGSTTTALADDPPPPAYILPYAMPEVVATTEQEVILVYMWAACSRGLVQNFLTAVHLEWEVDGIPLGADPELWTPPASWEDFTFYYLDLRQGCIVGHETQGHWSIWMYSLGTFAEAGDHLITVDPILDHPVMDGYDGKDGIFDGEPDLYKELPTFTTILHIVDAP